MHTPPRGNVHAGIPRKTHSSPRRSIGPVLQRKPHSIPTAVPYAYPTALTGESSRNDGRRRSMRREICSLTRGLR